MTRISIDPVTRLEGHGRIEIILDDAGDVVQAYFQVPELRGFEQFCIGRRVEDMPTITSRICGVCPEAHLLAAVKALDDLFMVTPPPAGQKIRELLYSAFFVIDHTTHFYLLGGPDFFVGPEASPADRNIFGVIRAVGIDVGKQVIACRARNTEVIKILGGRGIHPTGAVPGGWSIPVTETDRATIEVAARDNVEFALTSLRIFDQAVLGRPELAELLFSDIYHQQTYSMGTVDTDNRVNFYDGTIRVVDPDGGEHLRYQPREYTNHLAERVEPWTYMKFPYLTGVGWKGFVDGKDSGVYITSPLSRLNVADGMATPRAQEHYQRFYAFFGRTTADGRNRPIHHRMATHWARLIELLYAAERMVELATDPEITAPDIRTIPSGEINPLGGIGSVEAPRGTLTHHIEADDRGLLRRINLVVGTTNNHAAIAMSITRAAHALIKGGVIREGLLNRIEMALRLYDPCLSCATHSLPGKMPMIVTLRDMRGNIICDVRRDG